MNETRAQVSPAGGAGLAAKPCPAAPERMSGRAGDIVQAARELCEANGAKKLSVSAIAKHLGITRELVYYYFANKREILDAVIDDYVIDFAESVCTWNESRRFNAIEQETHKFVAAFHRCIYDAHGIRPSFRVVEELHMREEFLARVATSVVAYIMGNVVQEYERYHHIEITNVTEMFTMLIFGLVGMMILHPEMPEEKFVSLVAQTLRLDMVPLTEASPVGGGQAEGNGAAS